MSCTSGHAPSREASFSGRGTIPGRLSFQGTEKVGQLTTVGKQGVGVDPDRQRPSGGRPGAGGLTGGDDRTPRGPGGDVTAGPGAEGAAAAVPDRGLQRGEFGGPLRALEVVDRDRHVGCLVHLVEQTLDAFAGVLQGGEDFLAGAAAVLPHVAGEPVHAGASGDGGLAGPGLAHQVQRGSGVAENRSEREPDQRCDDRCREVDQRGQTVPHGILESLHVLGGLRHLEHAELAGDGDVRKFDVTVAPDAARRVDEDGLAVDFAPSGRRVAAAADRWHLLDEHRCLQRVGAAPRRQVVDETRPGEILVPGAVADLVGRQLDFRLFPDDLAGIVELDGAVQLSDRSAQVQSPTPTGVRGCGITVVVDHLIEDRHLTSPHRGE